MTASLRTNVPLKSRDACPAGLCPPSVPDYHSNASIGLQSVEEALHFCAPACYLVQLPLLPFCVLLSAGRLLDISCRLTCCLACS